MFYKRVVLWLLFLFLVGVFTGVIAAQNPGAQEPPPPDGPYEYPIAPDAVPNVNSPLAYGVQSDFPALENTLIGYINGLRRRLGATICLSISEQLRDAAYFHAQDMHDAGYFGFTNPNNQQSIGNFALDAGYTGDLVSGAISAGQDDIRDTPEEAFADITSSRSLYRVLTTVPQGGDWGDIGAGFFSGTQNFEDYWSVIVGRGAGNAGEECDISQFSRLTHTPTSGIVLSTSSTRPMFRWSRNEVATTDRVPADFFDVEILKQQGDGTFETTLRAPTDLQGPLYPAECVCQGTSCSLYPDIVLEAGATYQLWIRGYSDEGGYVWTDNAINFTINASASDPINPPTSPDCPRSSEISLESPAGTVNESSGNISYAWSGTSGTTDYEVYVGPTSSIGQAALYGLYDAERHCVVTDCSIVDTALMNERHRLYAGQYSAYFREWVDGEPVTGWSAVSPFTVEAIPPAIPTLGEVSYLTGTSISRPTFNWTLEGTATNATWFYVYSAPANNLGAYIANQWITREDACGSPVSTVCSYQAESDALTTGTYNLYIQSYGPGGFSTGGLSGFANSSYSITPDAPAIPEGFTVSVVNGRAKLDYIADGESAWYHVRVANNAGSTLAAEWFPQSPSNCDGLTCTYYPNINLQSGTYQTYLQAWGPGGFNGGSQFSESAAQTLDLNVGTTGLVSDLTVAYGASGRPDFVWTAGDNATWYNVVVASSDFATFYLNVWYPSTDLGCAEGGACVVTPNITLPAGSFVWYVGTWGPGGFGTGGLSGYVQGTSFSASSAAPTPPQPITPTSAMTNTGENGVSFQWQHQENVSWYEVTINTGGAADPVYTPIYNQWMPAESLDCRDDDVCEIALPYLGSGFYAWSIRAYGSGGLSDWADDVWFTIENGAAG